MKHILFYTILVFICSCDKKECDNEQAIPAAYKQVNVEFYLEHPSYEIEEAVFDTVSEIVLKKDKHREGALFETVTEQVLLKAGYSLMHISTEQLLTVVVNAEDDRITDITCRKFFEDENIRSEKIEPIYTTISYQKVFVDGSGPEIPAEYRERPYQRLAKDTKLVPRSSESRSTELVEFVIPVTKTFDNYLKEQLSYYDYADCGTEGAYRIIP